MAFFVLVRVWCLCDNDSYLEGLRHGKHHQHLKMNDDQHNPVGEIVSKSAAK